MWDLEHREKFVGGLDYKKWSMVFAVGPSKTVTNQIMKQEKQKSKKSNSTPRNFSNFLAFKIQFKIFQKSEEISKNRAYGGSLRTVYSIPICRRRQDGKVMYSILALYKCTYLISGHLIQMNFLERNMHSSNHWRS